MTAEHITTAAELGALPVGSILRNERGVAFELADEDHGRLLRGTNGVCIRDLVTFVYSWPLIVIYRPDRDLIAEAEARGARAAASPGEPDLLDAITDADDLRGRVRAVMRALRSIEAERDFARAALRDVKALASTWSPRAARKILAILARAEQAGSGRG